MITKDRANSPTIVPFMLLAALALSGCAVDAQSAEESSGDPGGERLGISKQAAETITLGPNMTCDDQPGIEAELTLFVNQAEANLLAQPIAGVGGYAIVASRRASAHGTLCAVATAGGMARTAHDSPSLPMTITTTTAVGSVSKVVTAAYVMDTLIAHGISTNAAIGPYLPPTWTRGPGIDETTFSELLTFTSGMPTNKNSMKQWVENGCLEGPTLTAKELPIGGPGSVKISVTGTWGAATDWVSIASPGSPDTDYVLRSDVHEWVENPDGQRWDGSASFIALDAGDYVARVFFNGSETKRAEIPFHLSRDGTITMGRGSFRGEVCPFRGGYRYSNAGFKILPLLAANISDPDLQAYLDSTTPPLDPVEYAGQYENQYVRTTYLSPVNDGATPVISLDPSCNSYKDYYAWGYPVSSTQSTAGSHDIPNIHTGCGQGTWYFSAQDLNFLMDRMHWNKVGSLGSLQEMALVSDIYGLGLHYGYDPSRATPNGFPFTAKGGLLYMGSGAYQAMAAHFPRDITVSVVVNSLRAYEDYGLYAPIVQAWDQSHPGSLWLDKTTFASGEAIDVHFSNGPGTAKDWIGIYPRDATPAPGSTAWDYCATDTHTPSSTGLFNGAVAIDAASKGASGVWPLAPGSKWTAYYLVKDGFTSIAKADFEIQP